MTAVTGRAIELLDAAGAAAATTLPAGEPLTAHPTAIEELTLVGAVVVPFAGSTSGELALLVDSELTNAMKDATIGEVDLALALAPTLEAVAAAIGPVVLGAAAGPRRRASRSLASPPTPTSPRSRCAPPPVTSGPPSSSASTPRSTTTRFRP